MNLTKLNKNGVDIARITSSELQITDVQSALDLIATVNYETGCDRIILDKSAVCEDFFDLKTQLAGEILQKFINYRVKVALIGDFSVYSSKSFKDFMYEINQGRSIFFLSNEEEALDKLSKA
ncbi:DUF4180 domain-containing protein [Paenibacillus puerhi]|uniref:DUF4180 domain-containing protein n=1 Tax=Paenibacillus puerhi TaxID=2692622 RepID=UPI001358B3E2|nr:DUF4180 domain-containing protein [Paenibacillus puerhi]